jgi:peptidoglycan DL-endopeptidase RipA
VRAVRVHARQLATVVTVTVLLVGSMFAGGGVALADPPPPPTPPPNPSDQQLDQSKKDVTATAGQVGRLTNQLADVQVAADRLGAKLEARQEGANKALVDLQTAQDAAVQAAARARATHTETAAASAAIASAHRQLDQFIAAAYQQGVEAGSFGLLLEAANPDELIRRAEFNDAIADQQRAALDTLERARIAKANADSLARAARADAQAKEALAAGAKRAADSAVATAKAAMDAGLAALAKVNAQREDIERQLDQLTAKDAGLRAQRQRYLDYQAQLASAGAGGPVVGGPGIQGVINRALSQLGEPYAWGGGNAKGPTKGIRDGGVADSFGDYRKTGFDCSGLMIYAFGAAGIGLPHYSGYQYDKGKKVPVAQAKPGDMLFWADGSDIHHVALYIGNGKMIEAPYSGGKVRISPVRYGDGLMPYAIRLL